MIFCYLFIGCFIAALGLTAVVRHYALKKALLDIPNARSSHTVPIPRGGGLAIVSVFLSATLILYFCQQVSSNVVLALVGGGILVASVGFIDDMKPLPARWRFFVQALAAAWALYWLGGFTVLDFGFYHVDAGGLGTLLAFIAIIWSINLYNFMDGIDGLAATEGVFIGIVATVFCEIAGDTSLALLSASLTAAIAGFLYWNWPPAKLFMGDVGSHFLGFVFIVIALAACNHRDQSLIFWLLLFAIFLSDATFTVVYRVLKKQRWYVAHREHAYQKGVDAGRSHQQVTLFIVALNALILLPAAVCAWLFPTCALGLWLLISYGLWLLWYKVRYH